MTRKDSVDKCCNILTSMSNAGFELDFETQIQAVFEEYSKTKGVLNQYTFSGFFNSFEKVQKYITNWYDFLVRQA